MHKYLTAAGFSTLDTERKVYEFLEEQVIREENLTDRAALMEGCSLREYRLAAADHIGICAGVLDLGTEAPGSIIIIPTSTRRRSPPESSAPWSGIRSGRTMQG